ncbi:MAG: tail fiber domain-containing protein [Burkholderiales bacterium]
MSRNFLRVSVSTIAAAVGASFVFCAPAFAKENQGEPIVVDAAGGSVSDVASATTAGGAAQTVAPLLAIDQNRATVIDKIVREWGGTIASQSGGITADQLRDVLSAMRADQLLAASLAGSADGLRAVVNNAMAGETGARSSFAKALGDVSVDVAYVPVTPCRLVETRGTFAAVYQGGGAFAPNAIRTYTLQGGNGVCLSQLPAGAAPTAIQLQVYGIPTTSGSGDIEILPQGGTFGSTATLVYLGTNAFTSSAATSLVNTTNNQISVQVRGGGAHVAIDVVGYFRPPSAVAVRNAGGSAGLKTTSTSSFTTVDIDAANGDAALRWYKAGVGMWNLRNRPADDFLELFELGGGGTRMVVQNGTGNVGIGADPPGYKLDVLHGGATGLRVKSSASFSVIDIDAINGDAALRFAKAGANQWNIRNNPANSDLQFFELGSAERLRIENTTGNVVVSSALGIGMTPTFQLQLSANSAAKPTSNAWTIASDMRVKENIQPFTDGLSTLLRINPVSYDLNGKAGLPKGEHGVSVIAQEARDVVPYMVSSFKAKLNPEDAEATDVLSFDSGALPFVTINAIKELVVMMGNQAATKDAEIASLKKKNAALEARLTAIEKKLKTK